MVEGVVGGVRMRIVMESEGWWVSMSFPNSTMETRCPLPRLGYRTMVSFMLEKRYEFLKWNWI